MKKMSEKKRRELLERARAAKENGEKLTEVFKAFAAENERAAGSIRNLYYRTIQKDLTCGLSAKKNEYFSESAENELIALLLKERSACGSLRKAAFKAANGDPVLALRYQNKYYSVLKKLRRDAGTRSLPVGDSIRFRQAKNERSKVKGFFEFERTKKRKRDEAENG